MSSSSSSRPLGFSEDASPSTFQAIPLQTIREEAASDADVDSDEESASFLAAPVGIYRKKGSRKMFSRYRYLPFWQCTHAACHARPSSARALLCKLLRRPFLFLIMFLGIWKFCSLTWDSLVYLFPDNLDSQLGAWHIPGGRYSIFSHWSTHGVNPVGCHSHNDYWREVPLRSAVNAGCIGVEADVWLSDNDLLVGHTRYTLHHDHTLRSLYVDPLLEILDKHNTPSSRLQPRRGDGADLAGVFSNDPSQTLVLLIDFKVDGDVLWPHVVGQLDSLRRGGYLTHFNGTAVVERPITVVATGNAPFHLIVANSTYRDIFLDAPLDQLKTRDPSPYEQLGLEEEQEQEREQAGGESLPEDYNVTNSYYASVDFRKAIGPLFHNRFSQPQLELLRAQVRAAHARGLKVRYWGTPGWPRGLRNHVWHILVREGVDLINVDDLREATMQDWRKHRSWFS
ncbi:hypothetical protein ANI_1_270114 [Paecilomyces variotii No. 5]|uniref:Altered inheritance of mitochondria protein 6 n=1 Tax=Byssochlamys spectabilis (strain No. 5 / NBRC 109023) TaxID=1356009 RepID=V5G197_BYSSN|nr:hypothetical protein ANI_1_270114 [Paecilomyces variotii No. 5]